MSVSKYMSSDGELTKLNRCVAAFLGAAVGDALGWPQERGGRKSTRSVSPTMEFREWPRRVGNRYSAITEIVRAGEYSDDTQLILAGARSLRFGTNWWEHFAWVELPFWMAYERGGGAATKRACARLLSGELPWLGTGATTDAYFEAGGNGVAMRILPHVLSCLDDAGFSRTATSVLTNGVCTHGHPRALVSALAYAYALRYALLRNSPLAYGELIRVVIQDVNIWAIEPSASIPWNDWSLATSTALNGQYNLIWESTITEVIDLLRKANDGISAGALAVDNEILEALGCFDKMRNGAGTVAAVAAIFLASRYAATPRAGLLASAFANGADTDTIASMACALMGAISGGEAFHPLSSQVQDSKYLREISATLLDAEQTTYGLKLDRVSQRDVNEFLLGVSEYRSSSKALPDGRRVLAAEPYSENDNGLLFKIQVADGQTLFVRQKLQKLPASEKKATRSRKKFPSDIPAPATRVPVEKSRARMIVRFNVSDMELTLRYYVDGLKMRVTKRSEKYVVLEDSVMLQTQHKNDMSALQASVNVDRTLLVYVDDIRATTKRLLSLSFDIVEPPQDIRGGQRMVSRDPNGLNIEIYERR